MDRDTDKGWAWMVLLAGYLQFVFSSGIYYTLSLYINPLRITFCQSREITAGVFALNAATHHLVGPLVPRLLPKLGSRGVAMLGGFLAAAGSFITVFVNDLNQIYFTYGIINGVGTCIIFCGWIVALSEYFVEKRNLALGVAMSGSGIGILVVGPVLAHLVDDYGWRNSMLISTGINLNLCVFGAVIYKKRPNPISNEETISIRDKNKVMYGTIDKFDYITNTEPNQICEYSDYDRPIGAEANSKILITENRISLDSQDRFDENYDSMDITSESSNTLPLLNKKRNLTMRRILIQLSCVFSLMATTTLYMLLDDWIRSTEIEKLTIYAFIAIGLGDVVGRTITGVVSWKICNDRHILVLFALNHLVLFSALVLAAFSTTVMEIILASFLIGFVGGVQTVLTAVATMNNEDVEELGILLVASGLGSFMGPPLAAYLVELFNYKIALIVTSTEPLIASLMCFAGYFTEISWMEDKLSVETCDRIKLCRRARD